MPKVIRNVFVEGYLPADFDLRHSRVKLFLAASVENGRQRRRNTNEEMLGILEDTGASLAGRLKKMQGEIQVVAAPE